MFFSKNTRSVNAYRNGRSKPAARGKNTISRNLVNCQSDTKLREKKEREFNSLRQSCWKLKIK